MNGTHTKSPKASMNPNPSWVISMVVNTASYRDIEMGEKFKNVWERNFLCLWSIQTKYYLTVKFIRGYGTVHQPNAFLKWGKGMWCPQHVYLTKSFCHLISCPSALPLGEEIIDPKTPLSLQAFTQAVPSAWNTLPQPQLWPPLSCLPLPSPWAEVLRVHYHQLAGYSTCMTVQELSPH